MDASNPSVSPASAADAAAAKRVQIEKAHNFMRQYRDPESRELKKLSANQFMDVWAHYDKDGKNSSAEKRTPRTFNSSLLIFI